MWWRGLGLEFQKLIKRKHPFLYDVSCICHLTNLTIKACLEDVDQLFVDVFYNFFHSSKWKQEFPDHWCSLFTSKPSTILKHCPTHWLRLCEIHPICHSSERVIKKAPENSTLASADAGISPCKKLNMCTACYLSCFLLCVPESHRPKLACCLVAWLKNKILFYSILFYSILFYSILFYSILFCSILFYSIFAEMSTTANIGGLFQSYLSFNSRKYLYCGMPLKVSGWEAFWDHIPMPFTCPSIILLGNL